MIGASSFAQADAPRANGRTYAVLVGVADYPSSPLPRTDVDAQRIADALRAHLPEDRLHMSLLLNRDATRANVTRALADVARDSTERDEVIFFFSGHGGTQEDQPNGDEGDGVDETIVLYDGSISDDELGAQLSPIKSRMSIVALDSCFSGGFMFDVSNEQGRLGMFSSDEDLTSAVPSQEAGGWLSLYLAEALEGRADGAADGVSGQERDGQLTALEIEMYVREHFRTQQRITATDTASREVGFQNIDIKRVGLTPDSVFMTLGGSVAGGVTRTVLAEQTGVTLPGTTDFAQLPRFEMQLESGRTYIIETYDLAGSTDTVLQLRRQNGAPSANDTVLAENDDAGGSLASRVRYTATESGTFYASVRPYAEQTGGTFSLRIVELTEDPNAPQPTVIADQHGIQLRATQDFAQLPNIAMQLEAGRTYLIETIELAGNTDTVLQLRRQDGPTPSSNDTVVAENDDAGGTLASAIRWTADRSGTFYAHVRPYAPQTAGTFGLRVTEIGGGSGPNTVAPVQPVQPVMPTPVNPCTGGGCVAPSPIGAVLIEQGNITLPASDDFASLPMIPMQLESGHNYRIETTNLAGNTDTVLQLRRQDGGAPSPSDTVIAENDDAGGSLASAIDWSADRSGTYYAIVRPYAPQTAGTFGLRVTDTGPVPMTVPVDPGQRPATGRALIERSNITLPASRDFSALPAIEMQLEAGHTYVIETFDLAGNTDTTIALRRGNGAPSPSDEVLAENDDAGGSLASRITYRAAEGGSYYVHVAPYGPDTGGTFSLRVMDVGAR